MERTALIIPAASVLLVTSALAAGTADKAPELDTVEVSATRLRSVQDIDVPASVTTVDLDSNRNRAQINVTEGLAGIPGVTALDRQNYAQDTQLSIRGFGARSTFGVRSLRIYSDGIPASMPDGQGQLSHFSMLAGQRMQVMRGPFSALYGNSSGGVVQMWSSPGSEDGPTRVRGTYGSFDARSLGAQTLGAVGPVDYNLAASRFETDGYRDHSAAQRDVINARIGFDTGPSRDLYLVGNYLDIPEAQDPLGLTRADWNADPRQVASVATQFNTRKSVEQLQGGVVFEQRFAGTQALRAMGYMGSRKINQVLGIPVNVQANPLHSGGVVDLDNDFRGVDLRWSAAGSLLGRQFEVTAGVNFDEQAQLRRGYENFQGSTLGVQGKLRRDEDNNVGNADQFAQMWWQFAERWSLLAGVRHSEVNFKSEDHYIVGTNPDDSGSRDYDDTTPVAGLMYRPSDSLRLYVAAGQGFETPTFNELSYRADGQAGLALNLEPVRSDNYELGAKWHLPSGTQFEAALFRANTRDELAVARNSGGRSSYRNIDSARRQGFETSAAVPLSHELQLEISYTWLDATFTSDFKTCVVAGCTVPNVLIPAGSRIPGVAEHQGMARLQWSPGRWNTALEFQGVSELVANDVGSEAAPGYGLLNIEAGRDWTFGQTTLRAFARVENLLDHQYIGSVIVNDGNGRYYESGPERSAMLGLQWQWR